MKLHILEIPDSAEQLCTWIESNVMLGSFGEFAGQLKIIRESGPEDISLGLTEILGREAQEMVEFGLGACSQKQLRQLLANSEALMELQEEVFANRYSYWFDEYLGNSAKVFDAQSDLQKIRDAVERPHPTLPAVGRRKFGWVIAAATLAASMMLILFLLQPNDSKSSVKWGWLADEAYQDYATPSECFADLAKRGNEWFDETPSDAAQFSLRLKELMAGCDRLIATKQAVLSAADQAWLTERCKKWADIFALQQTKLKTEPANFREIMQQTNETVRKLVVALNKKSNSPL